MTLLTEKQVSGILNVSESTLRRWRRKRKYLIFYRIGGGIKYKKMDVDTYLKNSRCPVTESKQNPCPQAEQGGNNEQKN